MSELLIMVIDKSGRVPALKPTDKDGFDALSALSINEMVSVKFTRPRNIKFHRKFFKMLQEVFKAHRELDIDPSLKYKDLRDMLDHIKIRLGYAKKKHVMGDEIWLPDSISFARMDETKFERFYNEFLDYCISTIIPGINKPDFERHLLSIADGRDYSEDRR